MSTGPSLTQFIGRFRPRPNRDGEQHERLPIQSNTPLQNDRYSIHEGLAVKRAFLFAGQPLLLWFGPVIPARTRCEHAGNRSIDEGWRVAEDPAHAESASKLHILEAVRGDGNALRVVPDRVHAHASLMEDFAT